MHAQGCDPSHLYSDKLKSLSNEVDSTVCDQPLSYIGTSDGYACYSGTLVGAYAVHRCLNCDYRSVRVCMADGNWNGTALQCNCISVIYTKNWYKYYYFMIQVQFIK